VSIRKAVIPAAGLGTRLLPNTKSVPKEMMPVYDRPAIQHIVEECVEAGVELVILVTGRYKGALQDHFDLSQEIEDAVAGKPDLLERIRPLGGMVDLVTIRQQRPLGLGHAVGCAKRLIDRKEAFLVLLPDEIFDNQARPARQLALAWDELGTAVLGVTEVPRGHEHLYGIVGGTEVGPGRLRVDRMVEKPASATAPSNLAIAGRYALPGAIFESLERTRPGHGGEIQLTDALIDLMRSQVIHAQRVEGRRYDIGQLGGWLEANLAYAMKDPELAARVRTIVAER
jgi:UTP--glucose-1-phosphate uridylyltransferase